MAELSRAKSIHLIVTGVILVIISSALFGLLYIIHGDQYEFGESAIFDRKTAFWVVIPVITTGLVGVLAGIMKNKILVILYLITSLMSTGLACLVSVGYGLRVTDIRTSCGEDSSCKNSDTAVMIGTIVLISAMLLSISFLATVRACQALWGPSKNRKKKRIISTIQYTRMASNGGPTVPVVNGRSNAVSVPVPVVVVNGNGTCHACGGIVNQGAAVNQHHEGSSGYKSINSTNHSNGQVNTVEDHGTHSNQAAKGGGSNSDQSAKDDGTANTTRDDGIHSDQAAKDGGSNLYQVAKDDGTASTTKDDETPKDDGPYYAKMDDAGYQTIRYDGVPQTAKDDGDATTAKDDGTASTTKDDETPKDDGPYYVKMDDAGYQTIKDDGVPQTAKDDGNATTAKDDGTASNAEDEGAYSEAYYSIADAIDDGIANQTVKDDGPVCTAKDDGSRAEYKSLDIINPQYESLSNETRTNPQDNATTTQINEAFDDDEELTTTL